MRVTNYGRASVQREHDRRLGMDARRTKSFMTGCSYFMERYAL